MGAFVFRSLNSLPFIGIPNISYLLYLRTTQKIDLKLRLVRVNIT